MSSVRMFSLVCVSLAARLTSASFRFCLARIFLETALSITYRAYEHELCYSLIIEGDLFVDLIHANFITTTFK